MSLKKKSKNNNKPDKGKKQRASQLEQALPAKAADRPLLHELSDVAISGDTVMINQREYHIVANERGALDTEQLRQKYDPYLDQYDYLVGDISSEHLRLKGFYNDYVKTAIDRKKSTIVDYLAEYCNPGAPYFILASAQQSKKPKIKIKNRKHSSGKKHRGRAAFSERKVHETKLPRKNSHAERKRKNGHHQAFVIRKKNKREQDAKQRL